MSWLFWNWDDFSNVIKWPIREDEDWGVWEKDGSENFCERGQVWQWWSEQYFLVYQNHIPVLNCLKDIVIESFTHKPSKELNKIKGIWDRPRWENLIQLRLIISVLVERCKIKERNIQHKVIFRYIRQVQIKIEQQTLIWQIILSDPVED